MRVADQERDGGQAKKGSQLKHDYRAQIMDQERDGSPAEKEDHLKHGFRARAVDQQCVGGQAKKAGCLKRDSLVEVPPPFLSGPLPLMNGWSCGACGPLRAHGCPC